MSDRDVDLESHNSGMPINDEDAERRDVVIHANYELFVAGILIVQLINSALLFVQLFEEQREIVLEFWIGLSAFLIIDALIRIRRAPKKRRHIFTQYGWITLVGSMPIPFVTGARLVGMAFVLRKLQRGEVKEIGNVVVARHAQSTLLLVIFLAVVIFEFGSLMVLIAEEGASDANITTSEDAVWWSLVTISTVGYGDKYPTTYWGRIVGYILIISGVGLFTSITSFLSRWFMRPRKKRNVPLNAPDVVEGPRAQVREIRSLLEELERNHSQTVSELEDRLNRLEDSVAVNNDQ